MMRETFRGWRAIPVIGMAMVGAVLVAATAAMASCPDAATATKGFKMTHAGGRYLEVTRYDGDIVHYREQLGSHPNAWRDNTAFRGVAGLTSTGADEKNEITWSKDPASIFPLKVGAVHEFDIVANSSKGTVLTGRFRLEIGQGPIGLGVGACGYEVWPLKRDIVWNEKGIRIVGTDYWSPALNIYLRRDIESHMPGKAPMKITLDYDTIEARP